ncbi:MAG: cob(I)yrinic acid a,c-diamide adenosyltransferase [Candidatus Omnitrophica bacterium]|nr:cob(I)yrinic acid a,c-diamide adenosyltransferase [Candidatus Omnitrophota bacterium]
MRLTRIYTRTGDKGDTGLAGGVRVGKDSDRIEAYGTVDELNSIVGIVRSFFKEVSNREIFQKLDPRLYKMQNILFVVGADLATAPGKTYPNRVVVQEKQVTELENWIDEWQADLKPLPEFILPGGGKIASFLHQARTVCRRAERIVIRLSRKEEVRPEVIHYLNRLSDALFVLARWVALKLSEEETLWDRSIE